MPIYSGNTCWMQNQILKTRQEDVYMGKTSA